MGRKIGISELSGSWRSVHYWRAVWQLVSCVPLASSVAAGKLWQLAICVPVRQDQTLSAI